MKHRFGSALGALLLGVLAACAAPGGSEDNHGVTAVQFSDTVVPAGFVLNEDAHLSYSREEPGYRHGHFVYSGSARIDEACSYIRLRMPQHAWQLAAEERPSDTERVLRFERGRYTAEYQLRRRDGVTHLVIDYRTDIPER